MKLPVVGRHLEEGVSVGWAVPPGQERHLAGRGCSWYAGEQLSCCAHNPADRGPVSSWLFALGFGGESESRFGNPHLSLG